MKLPRRCRLCNRLIVAREDQSLEKDLCGSLSCRTEAYGKGQGLMTWIGGKKNG